MTKLLKYHSTMANPNYYWENNKVATMLRNGQLQSYLEYRNACKEAGCVCYNEDVWNEHVGNDYLAKSFITLKN